MINFSLEGKIALITDASRGIGEAIAKTLIDAQESVWDKTFEVNLKGPFFMIQHVARLMKASGGRAIVNVASINAVAPMAHQGIYAITKAGLVSMTKSYAKELVGSNIRVNALLPGITATKLAGVLTEDAELIESIPMKRAAQPLEMGGTVLYLVSDASSYTTGTSIICDGGLTA